MSNLKLGAAIHLQAWRGPLGSRRLKLPDFQKIDKGYGKVFSPTHRPPLLPWETSLVLFSVRSWVDPRAIARSEGINQRKLPMAPSGIQPANFRFVAQYEQHRTIMNPVTWLNQLTSRTHSLVVHLQYTFGPQQNELPPETWRILSLTQHFTNLTAVRLIKLYFTNYGAQNLWLSIPFNILT
jgi:hypothetical protein